MSKLKIFLLADIYPTIGNLELFQEWESLESILILKDTLEEMGHSVEILEPYLHKRRILEKLSQHEDKHRAHTILWNLVEGYFSKNREAYVPALAEFLGFPYTGSDAYAQIISLDKNLTKLIANSIDIPTPASFVLESVSSSLNLPYPIFIKPNFEGSSLGISQKNRISSPKEWEEFQSNLRKEFFPYLVEEYLEGKEYTVGILGQSDQLFATRVLEVVSPAPIYSAEIKSKSQMPEKFFPLNDSEKEKWIQSKSLELASKIGVSGFARLDWKEKNDIPYFLEINLTPGLSKKYSALPICAEVSGLSYCDLLNIILDAALIEYQKETRDYGKKGYDFF